MLVIHFRSSLQKYIDMAACLEGLSPNVPLYKVTEGNEPCFFTIFFSWDSTRATVCVFLTGFFYLILELLSLQLKLDHFHLHQQEIIMLYSQLVYAKWDNIEKMQSIWFKPPQLFRR